MTDRYSKSRGLGLAARLVGKDFVQVAAVIQYTNNLGSVTRRTIEDNVRSRRDGSEPGTHLIPRSSSERVILKQPARFFDVTDDAISRLRRRDLGVVPPDLAQVSQRVPRP